MWVIVSPRAKRPPIAQPAAAPAPMSSVPTRIATLTSVDMFNQLIGFCGAAAAKSLSSSGAGPRPCRPWAQVSRPASVERSRARMQSGAVQRLAMSILAEPSRHAGAAPREHVHAPRGGLGALSLGALGVVYGDIGTSPLYAM